jgi:hypothetical protein
MNSNPTFTVLAHTHTRRLGWREGRPDPATPECPGCGAPLALDLAADADGPLGATGTCDRPCCGEVVTFRRFEGRLIVAGRRRA